MKKAMLILIIAIFPVGCFSKTYAEKKEIWLQVLPLDQSIEFVDHVNEKAEIKIFCKNGAPLYLLECYLNAYDHATNDFDYSGDFECRLTSLNGDNRGFSTLLTEEKNQSSDWESRGRFLLEEITGKCAEYPDYGKVRYFKLRNMNLTLSIKKLELEPNKSNDSSVHRIKRLVFGIQVVPDTTATSEIAEQSKFKEPLFPDPKNPSHLIRDCDKVSTVK